MTCDGSRVNPYPEHLDDLLATDRVAIFDGLLFCTACASPLAPVASLGLAVATATEHLSSHCRPHPHPPRGRGRG